MKYTSNFPSALGHRIRTYRTKGVRAFGTVTIFQGFCGYLAVIKTRRHPQFAWEFTEWDKIWRENGSVFNLFWLTTSATNNVPSHGSS
jgi:hypothetical protein